MKQNSNKFLIAMVIGVILLVVAAFVVVLSRPAPEYQAEDSPEGVAHNYLLALEKGDHQRAFEYLSSTLEHPADAQAFLQTIEESPWDFQLQQDVSLTIESTSMPTSTSANVTVRQNTFSNEGLFNGNPSSETFNLRLVKENDQWKLIDGDRYWSYCWGDKEICLENPEQRQ